MGKKETLEIYDVGEQLRRGRDAGAGWIKRHPWESVGIAALMGAFVTTIFRRKR